MDKPDFKAFTNDILAQILEGYDLDAHEVHTTAVRHGVLKKVVAQESCGKGCLCDELTDFPTECYRKTYTTIGDKP